MATYKDELGGAGDFPSLDDGGTTSSYTFGGLFGQTGSEDYKVPIKRKLKVTEIKKDGVVLEDGTFLSNILVSNSDGTSIRRPTVTTKRNQNPNFQGPLSDEVTGLSSDFEKVGNDYYFDVSKLGRAVDRNASEVMKEWADKAKSSDVNDSTQFKAMQEKLFKAGFIKKKPVPGIADVETSQALETALQYAASTGKTLDELLDYYIVNNPNGSNGDFNYDRSVELVSRDTVEQVVRQQAPEMLGGLPLDQVEAITQKYNDLQRAQSDRQYQIALAQNNGDTSAQETTSLPDITTFVSQELRDKNPVAAKGQAMGEAMGRFMALLG